MNRLVTLAVASLTVAGCGNELGIGDGLPPADIGSPRPPATVEQVDIIVQVTTPKVDSLFVIDNSCSMFQEQSDLTANFPFFIGYFLGSGLDYHVGVTSTDMDGRLGNNGTKGRLRTIQGYKYIDPETANPTQVFAGMAGMGTAGSASERGTSATYECLETKRDGANSGYFRDEASIHTVSVSDEPNQIRNGEIPLPEFIDWYDGLKRDTEDRTFSSIVNSRGTDYKRVTNTIGGINWDLTDENWRVVLDRLGVQASGLKREYYLSQRPVESTIDVTVEQPILGYEDEYNLLAFTRAETDPDGNPLEGDEGDYTYDATRNSITFLTFVPEALSRVIIRYDLLASTQDGLLGGGEEGEGDDDDAEQTDVE